MDAGFLVLSLILLVPAAILGGVILARALLWIIAHGDIDE